MPTEDLDKAPEVPTHDPKPPQRASDQPTLAEMAEKGIMRQLTSAEMAERLDSVEISQNAKGEVSFKVKAYATSLEEAVLLALPALDQVRAELEKRRK
jgi:hypothetical protein